MEYKVCIFNSSYLIYNDGRIYSKIRNRFLSQGIGNNGYLIVKMNDKNGKSKKFLAHRVIADHFVDHPLGFDYVNHIDKNKTNNDYRNLEWTNNSQNQIHSHADKRKYTEEQIKTVKTMLHNGCSYREIEIATHVKPRTVYNIKIGKQWKHII